MNIKKALIREIIIALLVAFVSVGIIYAAAAKRRELRYQREAIVSHYGLLETTDKDFKRIYKVKDKYSKNEYTDPEKIAIERCLSINRSEQKCLDAGAFGYLFFAVVYPPYLVIRFIFWAKDRL